ncbi:MAG: lipopolysaccharide heptosyltransferase II [Pseudohongiella sp.]|nr:lipopolysaccharide heptosyltransferase II [Pseudohongiella sp.]MDO9518821.1 lipopolysaccharide heptosyltransferase II [Pseudohongiella sp.]MDP2128797.1 lipopolysaccharide heptosyltransferase II [Pseudohongiella sp.]
MDLKATVSGKILVIGPSWVGDMVMAQSLFKELHQLHAGLQLDVLAPAWSRPILERMPEVSHAIDLPFAHGEFGLGKRYKLGRSLRNEQYQQVIVLPNSFKSALVPWFAKIPRRTGWRGEQRGPLLNDCRILDKNRYPLMVQRFVALAYPAQAALHDPIPVPQLVSSKQSALQAVADLGLGWTSDTSVLALCPGAEFGDAKQWPAEHYAAVAEEYSHRGWRIALMGSAKDRGVCEQIVARLPHGLQPQCDNLAGRTSLAQVIDLLSLAKAVVSNDSGLMHISAALHRPLVAVYGSTSADFTPPLSDQVQLLHTDISCRPCFKRQCPYGHKRCLTELLPQQVLKALDNLLGGVQLAQLL